MNHTTPLTLLNGLTSQQFLDEYWQKKPLLIRGAIPGFSGLLDPNELAGLACEEGVQARLIQHHPKATQANKRWQVAHGPFDEADFARLPSRDWTLLVQGVNHFLPEAQALLQQFSFIPNARLDDVMVSYAPTGGGVGPHTDSYDVFLLQGAGQRCWRISQQQDMQLEAGAPLRILSNFETEQEWVLAPGDMLYLPPHVAHWGLAADDDCMTYSIGFRVPHARELAIEFLESCREQGLPDCLYADADLQASQDPAAIDDAMVRRVQHLLQQLQWQPELLGPFLACYFSEPKAHIVFEGNAKLSLEKFVLRLHKHGLVLDLKSQLLHHHGQYFINGESIDLPETAQHMLSALAIERALPAAYCAQLVCPSELAWLREIYLAGYADFA